MWDESFYGISALEMSINHNFLIKYYEQHPDVYNLKPLLITWVHTLLFMTIGAGELALRLPSALSGLFIVIILFFFLKNSGYNIFYSLLACLILLTSKGFISDHVTRTGDLDAPLTLFLFISSLSFFRFLSSDKYDKSQLSLTFLFTFLAFLTKGIAGLLFIPGFFIALLFSDKLIKLLKDWYFYLLIILLFSLIAAYYLLIDSVQPGYFSLVLDNEILGRYFDVQDGHSHPFFYYFKLLFSLQFFPWIFLLPVSLFIITMNVKNKNNNFFIFSWIIVLSYLLIISCGKSKLEWYTAPVFPFLAVIAAHPLLYVSKYLIKLKIIPTLISKALIMFMLIVFPYSQIIDSVYFPENNWAAQKYGAFFKQIRKNHPEITTIKVLHEGWNSHLIFYTRLYHEKYGYNLIYINNYKSPHLLKEQLDDIEPGDFIIAYQTEILDPLYRKFNAAILDRYDELVLVKMFSLKKS